jgi:hypothetical protein
MFRHDSPLAVKPASTPRRLGNKQKKWRDSLPIDMLSFGVTIPATVPQRAEIPEGLTNYSVLLDYDIKKTEWQDTSKAWVRDNCVHNFSRKFRIQKVKWKAVRRRERNIGY